MAVANIPQAIAGNGFFSSNMTIAVTNNASYVATLP